MLTSQTRETIKWFFGVTVTVTGIMSIVFVMDPPARFVGRFPAAIGSGQASPEKVKTLMGESKPDIHKLQKGSGALEIQITSPQKSNLDAGSVIELEASVTAKMDLNDLQFGWLLPEGITAETGSVDGQIGKLAAGESTTLRLTIKSTTNDNRRVHLHVFRHENGEPSGKMAQYNTVDQEVIEAKLTSKAEMLQKAEEEEGHVQKVMQ